MTSIIKPLKTKQEDGTEQVVFPKTLSEAVIDSETNKTLDVILDELNNKIDNIEIVTGNTTYELGRTDDTITLTGSDGNSSEVDITTVENLLVYPYAISNETTDNYTIVDNKDGTLTISCNFPELSAANVRIVSNQPISAGTYTISGCPEGTVSVNIYVDDTSGNRIHYSNLIYGQNFTFTVTELCYLSLNLGFNLGASLTDAVLKPMLELGTVAHPYKPYKDVSKANQTDIDNKVSKSGDTMTGMLTVKDNVSVEGDLFVPITPEQSILNNEQPNTNFTAPTSGGWQDNTTSLTEQLPISKTFLGSYNGKTKPEDTAANWQNVISVRHRNGRGDGGNYGMYIRSNMADAGSLLYNKQYNGNWQGEKVILDSINYNQYAQPKITGGATTITNSNLTVSRALVSDSAGKIAVSAVTSTQLGYLSGVTSAIQTQLNGKQATITGAATSVVSSNLTASRALYSDANGKIAASSSVTSTELSYLDGVTSAIQSQLNGKQASISGSANASNGYLRIPGLKIQVAWKRVSWTGKINTVWGLGYETASAISLGNWAANFSSAPAVSYTAQCNNSADVGVNSYVPVSTSSAGSVYLQRNSAEPTDRVYIVHAIAIGKYS